MEPRLTSSKQWTPFPEEFSQQILETYNEFFADYDLNGQFFSVEGRIYEKELLFRVGLNHPQRLRQDNIEVSFEYSPEEDKALENIHLVVDFTGHFWEDLLEDEKDPQEVPKDWQEATWEKNQFSFRYSSINTSLEEQANALLNEDKKQLVYD